jgi:hypothetical protein
MARQARPTRRVAPYVGDHPDILPIEPPLKYRDVQPRINQLGTLIDADITDCEITGRRPDRDRPRWIEERASLEARSGVVAGWDSHERMERLRRATAAKDKAHADWLAAVKDCKATYADTVDEIARAAGFTSRDGVNKLLRRHTVT